MVCLEVSRQVEGPVAILSSHSEGLEDKVGLFSSCPVALEQPIGMSTVGSLRKIKRFGFHLFSANQKTR